MKIAFRDSFKKSSLLRYLLFWLYLLDININRSCAVWTTSFFCSQPCELLRAPRTGSGPLLSHQTNNFFDIRHPNHRFSFLPRVLGRPEPQYSVPILTQQPVITSAQPYYTQIGRQPETIVSGLVGQPSYTQVVGQPLLQQVVGQPAVTHQVLNPQLSTLTQHQLAAAGLVPYAGLNSGVVNSLGVAGLGLNGVGVAGAGYNTVNVNGVTYLVPGIGSGLQHLNTVPATSLVQQPVITQPLINVGQPVIREADPNSYSSVAQLDPMDAALYDMESKGQMHMEKYAWGRSAPLTDDKPTEVNEQELRAGLPLYYATLPTTGVVRNPGEVLATPGSFQSIPNRSRNTFLGLGAGGGSKPRKKHFEHYSFF